MKIVSMVKMGAYFLVAVIIVGCHEYTPPTSHYGTGRYRCFYHDARNGQLYRGIADSQDDAILAAKNACRNAPPKDIDHKYCHFGECIFK